MGLIRLHWPVFRTWRTSLQRYAEKARHSSLHMLSMLHGVWDLAGELGDLFGSHSSGGVD